MRVKHLLFDWGDTLMVDDPAQKTPMATWDKVSTCDGVLETMPLIAGRVSCSVASNASDSDIAMMKKAFERVKLDGFFQHYFTSKELGAKKPNPLFFQNAAKLLGAQPNEVCMIGNNYESDIVGAKAVGLVTVLITISDGHFPAADYVMGEFSQLVNVVDKLLENLK
jgi:putative hydrolase of the HAD superfamily